MVRVGLFNRSLKKGCEVSRNLYWAHEMFMPVTIFAESRFADADKAPPGVTKIAWIQTLQWYKSWRKKIGYLRDNFDAVLTYSREMVELEPYCLYCPADWITANPRKYADVPKDGLYTFSTLPHVVARHKYAVVTELRINGRFSRKLLNCFALGTIPIYNGAPDIADYFDYGGIIQYRDDADLNIITNYVGDIDYNRRGIHIDANRETSYQYLSAGDWLYKNYPYLFEICDEQPD